jgi:hypothetical protein
MRTPLTGLVAAVALAGAASAQNPSSIDGFEVVSRFGVDGVAEIVAASADGKTLLYTNSDAEAIGFVDISDPATPAAITEIPVNGEPTSVSVHGRWAIAGVWTDKPSEGDPPPAFLPAELVVIDISNSSAPVVTGSVSLGYHPDSVKLVEVGGQLVALVAIENEPVVVVNGVVTGDDVPGDPNDISPAGYVQVIQLDPANPAASTVADVLLPEATLASAGLQFADDPQPEFIDVSGTLAAVSLQENNGVALIDITHPGTPVLARVFSTGTASNRPTDLTEDSDIRFDEVYPAMVDAGMKERPEDAAGNILPGGLRMPDALAFHPSGSFLYTADEGEMNFTGGRGWSGWSLNGTQVYDDRGELENAALRLSYFPEGRAENKGVEMEGVTTARFGFQDLAFVLSERGCFMAVYDITRPRQPKLLQLAPTGIGPEGVVAIPSRDLVVTSEEESGTMTVFRATTSYQPDADEPVLFSKGRNASWAALSGLCSNPTGNALFAVPDNAMPTAVYRVDIGGSYAEVRTLRSVTKNGTQARYDGEGICLDTSIVAPGPYAGWWIASEGDADTEPNLLVQVSAFGSVLREIQLPASIDPAATPGLPGFAQPAAGGQMIRKNGFEGVTLSADGRYLLAVIQRDFDGEFSGPKYTRIARYDLGQLAAGGLNSGLRYGGDWEFFFLQLDSDETKNWAGLSEITTLGPDRYAVVERDKEIGIGSELKKVYEFGLAGLVADADGVPDASDTVVKVELRDLLSDFFPFEKVEGLAVTPGGDLWVGLDNDGGEVQSKLVNTGSVD